MAQPEKVYGEVRGPYEHPSVRKRIEALFLDNLGKVLRREDILEAARDPRTGAEPENWHQRLSELRTDFGYTILTNRDRPYLRPGEYLMPSAELRPGAGARTRPTRQTWLRVLERAGHGCEWSEGGVGCGLANGGVDPIGGGTVRLTPDHHTPHSVDPNIAADDPTQWQALCGRHQVMKKNFWDSGSGKLNAYAIVQAATLAEKRAIFEFLTELFAQEGYPRVRR